MSEKWTRVSMNDLDDPRPVASTGGKYVVDRTGRIVNTENGVALRPGLNGKGYPGVSLHVGGRKYTVTVHRLVALAFLDIPHRHKEVPFNLLQVNHIDGNKENNHVDNLEWVTNTENMAHARANKLFSNESATHALNIYSKEVMEFPSISEAARSFGFPSSALHHHLHSDVAGILAFNGWVLKLQDDSPWPSFWFKASEKTTPATVCKIVAYPEENRSDVRIFNTFREAARSLGFDWTHLNNHRARKGAHLPFNGWFIETIEMFKCKGNI